MATISSVCVPLAVLTSGRYTAAFRAPGSLRPSGAGLTGADLALFYLVLDAAEHTNAEGVVHLPQTSITRLLQREHPGRISAALDRLRGTNLMMGLNLAPCIVAFDHIGKGVQPRIWVVRLDRRVLELLRGKRVEVGVEPLRALSSRYSLVLYSRWVAMLNGALPAREIGYRGKFPKERTAEVTLSVEQLPEFFGYSTPLRQSEIKRLLLTKSPKCPIGREMRMAMVATDIVPMHTEHEPKIALLKILMTGIGIKGIAHTVASRRHASIEADNRRLRRLEREKAAI